MEDAGKLRKLQRMYWKFNNNTLHVWKSRQQKIKWKISRNENQANEDWLFCDN